MKYPSVFFFPSTQRNGKVTWVLIFTCIANRIYHRSTDSLHRWLTPGPGSSAEWVGALTQNRWLYFLSETVVNNTLPKKLKNAWSKVKLLPNGLQISLDRLYCLTDKKYSSPKTRPYLSVFPPCFRLFCFPKLCLSICLGIWYLLVLPTSFIIILLIDSSTFTTASWSQGSVFSRKSLAVFRVWTRFWCMGNAWSQDRVRLYPNRLRPSIGSKKTKVRRNKTYFLNPPYLSLFLLCPQRFCFSKHYFFPGK